MKQHRLLGAIKFR